MEICSKFAPYIQWLSIMVRVSLRVKKHNTIAIWKLVTTGSLWFMVNHFGMNKSMAGEAMWKVHLVIQRLMALHIICLADPWEVVDRFSRLRFSNCTGAVNGTY